jgi:hypothetical protein
VAKPLVGWGHRRCWLLLLHLLVLKLLLLSKL